MDKKRIYNLYLKKVKGEVLTSFETEELNKARFAEPEYYTELQVVLSSEASIKAFEGLDEQWYNEALKPSKKRIYRWMAVASVFVVLLSVGYFLVNNQRQINNRNTSVIAKVDYNAVIKNEATITTEHQSYALSEEQDTTYKIDDFEVEATVSNSLVYKNEVKQKIAWHTIETKIGFQYKLVLADNSVIYFKCNRPA